VRARITREDSAVPQLDVTALGERLSAYGISAVRPLTGGASSLTYLAARGDAHVVVKVAPPGLPPVLHRDVLRQARLLRALACTPVPVPEVLLEDPGAPIEVPPLFVMAYVDGSSLEPLFDLEPDGAPADVMADRLLDAARVLARLHAVPPAEAGLLNEAVGTPTDEVARWSRTLQTVDASLVAGWQDVAEMLRGSAPAALAPTIVHGDFRLGNLLAAGRQITAVLDWEIWSVGDPRVDLSWFLLNADPDTYRRSTPYVGTTPSRAELIAAYSDALGRNAPEQLDWFVGLAAFKSAATWGLIAKHNRRRPEPDVALEAMAAALPRLLDRAREAVR
jgi:aminoglycoside phosphotransferase (APT) family kinase protein